MQAPVTVLQANTRRDTGKKAQYGNIMAAKVGGVTALGARVGGDRVVGD